jgi:hypothetical protein
MITFKDVQSPFSVSIVDGKKVILMGDFYVPLNDNTSDQIAEMVMSIMEFYYKLGFMTAIRQMAQNQD